jgi:hypothetical protein
MGILIFNAPGLIILIAGFGIGFLLRNTLGLTGEPPVLIIGGLLISAFDLAYRLYADGGHWLKPQRGGSLFFLPAWCFGIFWVIVGIVRSAS